MCEHLPERRDCDVLASREACPAVGSRSCPAKVREADDSRGLANPNRGGTTESAPDPGGRSAVLQCDSLGVFYFHVITTLETECMHCAPPIDWIVFASRARCRQDYDCRLRS